MSQFVSSRWSLRAVGGKDSTGQTQGGLEAGRGPPGSSCSGSTPWSTRGDCRPAAGQADPAQQLGHRHRIRSCFRNGPEKGRCPFSARPTRTPGRLPLGLGMCADAGLTPPGASLPLPLSVSVRLFPSLTPPTHTSPNWNSHQTPDRELGVPA